MDLHLILDLVHTSARGQSVRTLPIRRLSMSTRHLSVAAACVAGLLAATPLGTVPQPRGAAYLDPTASVSSRVEDLLHRMTLPEKIGQMDQIVVGSLRDSTNPADGNCRNAGGNTDPLQVSCLDNVLIK